MSAWQSFLYGCRCGLWDAWHVLTFRWGRVWREPWSFGRKPKPKKCRYGCDDEIIVTSSGQVMRTARSVFWNKRCPIHDKPRVKENGEKL